MRAPRRVGSVLAPRNWRVACGLIVLVAIPTLLGLTLAGFRVADESRSGETYAQIGQLAVLGQQVTGLAEAMEDERADTGAFIAAGHSAARLSALNRQYLITDRRLTAVRRLILRRGAGNPAQSDAATIRTDIAQLPGLRQHATRGQGAGLTVINGYSTAIESLLQVNDGLADMSGNLALTTSVRSLESLSRMADEAALQQVILDAALSEGRFGPGALTALATASAQQASEIASFRGSATREQRWALTDTLAEPLAGQARVVERRAMATGGGVLALGSGASQQWAAGMSYTVGWMRHSEQQLASWITAYTQNLHRSAIRSAMTTGGLALIVLLLVVIATTVIARFIARPAGDDGRPRGSLNAVFVSFLRRYSSLLEPSLRLIDGLELTEEDPERLAALFQLDHLATLMRRHSDRALVLAGDQTPRRWTEPVTLIDLLRAALSEIEEYGRVVLDVEPTVSIAASATVTASAAVDIVHMLAELLENAATFSPVTTQVSLSGRTAPGGGWLVIITDRGSGMPEEQLTRLNGQLADPPPADMAVPRHMGLFAVAHLAARHGIRVEIVPSPSGGTSAEVHIPAALMSRMTTAKST